MALQVIGAGFGRTGTLSLKLAVERLGVGRCYHMLEFRERPDHVPLWRQVADGRQGLWDAIFDRYRASVDWPGCRFWRDLATHYPNAKIVLTIRDSEHWYESISNTIYPGSSGDQARTTGHTISSAAP